MIAPKLHACRNVGKIRAPRHAPEIVTTAARPLLSPAWRIAVGLVLLTFLAYADNFSGLYLFDDASVIPENPSIRHFSTALFPAPNGTPVSGRPLANLTFAADYALAGTRVWIYHATNLVIHLLATLALFSLLRRTLELPAIAPRFRAVATEIAGTVALLWAVHPLQTEAVSYLAQRAESLMGLFYLLTLDGLVRAVTTNRRGWLVASVAACLGGMASKEVMISAPLLALLYDRTFLAGSFAAALRQRTGYYAALGGTWVLLAAEMIYVGNRGNAVGPGLKVDAWHYALTQCYAIVLYLRLALWPHPLTFDYGTTTVDSFGAVWPEAALLAVLGLATLYYIGRRSALGFIGAWFFAILAPTSSVVPLAKQTIAEHRMYLPLASVLLLVVLGLHAVGLRTRWTVLLAAPLLLLTFLRNLDYVNGVTIWEQSVARYPDNPRAHIDLGEAYFNAGQVQRGAEQFRAALQLDPALPEAHNNLGVAENALGQPASAAAEFREALRLSPGWDKPQRNLDDLRRAHPDLP
jgi:tetratricopeptide (TPR) repeat protein